MRERYNIVQDARVPVTRTAWYMVIDRRAPDDPVCWCADHMDATRIVMALNQQYREGAERRAARRAHV